MDAYPNSLHLDTGFISSMTNEKGWLLSLGTASCIGPIRPVHMSHSPPIAFSLALCLRLRLPFALRGLYPFAMSIITFYSSILKPSPGPGPGSTDMLLFQLSYDSMQKAPSKNQVPFALYVQERNYTNIMFECHTILHHSQTIKASSRKPHHSYNILLL